MRKRRFTIMLIAGAAIAIASAVGGDLQFADATASPAPQRVPGRFGVSLGSGQWEIYQLTGSQTDVSAGGLSVSVTKQLAPAPLTASMVTVTAPGGTQLPVQSQSAGMTQTLRKGSDIYTGVAAFRAPGAGKYSVSVNSPGTGSVVLARPVLAEFLALLPWLGAALLGFVCLVVGLIGVVVARRRNPALPEAALGPRPAGGH